MEDVSFTEQLLDLLQKQSYYAGKLSAVLEIDESDFLEDSRGLNKKRFLNRAKSIIKLYNKHGFYLRDGKKIMKSQREACTVLKEIVKEDTKDLFDERIESFGISPRGIPTVFSEHVIDYIAEKEGIGYDDILAMLDICRSLGLIAQLYELCQFKNKNMDIVENLMYSKCVEVMNQLEYSDSYDLARDVYTYSNFNLDDYDSVIEASLALGENFDQGIDCLSRNNVKVYTK